MRRFVTADAATVAVDGLSLQVQAGQVYGLLGANGAGKTTTLRLIATLLRPDRGSIHVGPVDALSDPLDARARLAYVPAEAGLPAELRPIEAVALFAGVQGVAEPVSRARSLLTTLGAASFADRRCGSLSTGQKRRVVLARALVHAPPLLLLDEPTDGLDVSGRNDVLELVRQLARGGTAVLFSSHILGEVDAVCDRVGVMRHGRLVAEGTVPERCTLAGEADLGASFLKLVADER